LGAYAYPRQVISLILSDVIGNDLQTIASGPTVPDLTTFEKAIEICKKYQIFDQLPRSVQQRLLDGKAGKIPETPKPNPKTFETTTNLVIGSAETSAEAAEQEILSQNIPCEIYSTTLAGEAREYGKKLVDLIPKFKSETFPAVFIGTGEFTVTIKGKGKGGRNQEMLLAFLNELQNDPEHPTNQLDFAIISGAFDGIEGNSPAMGAIIDSESIHQAKRHKLVLEKYLENNDSFSFFNTMSDALITGQTGTNVNDMTIIVIHQIKKT
jgi:glycerate-2-kinase